MSFKRHTKEFLLGLRVPVDINVGDAVIVSAGDRQEEDLGIVTRIESLQNYVLERFQTTFIPNFSIENYVGRIFRKVTPREYRLLGMKKDHEQEIFTVK